MIADATNRKKAQCSEIKTKMTVDGKKNVAFQKISSQLKITLNSPINESK